ncbi:hypothetical protein CASFOL_042203 [Castilleja foliolosa]|uniref:Uncharacterized protein n=1 Tax=Castilleja foliolosa TaxID=1961234 RepID=A0ABD3BA40_9LAMI
MDGRRLKVAEEKDDGVCSNRRDLEAEESWAVDDNTWTVELRYNGGARLREEEVGSNQRDLEAEQSWAVDDNTWTVELCDNGGARLR